jgi:hypothetical protein
MKIQKLISLVGIFAAAILFMGCPYSSQTSITETGAKVPDSMLGTWELSSSGEGAKDKIEISKADNNKVNIVKTAGYDGTVNNYKGFFSEVGGSLYANVYEESEYGITYYFYKIVNDGANKINVMEVTPYIRETFDNSAALKSFIEANQKNSYFFTTDESVYYKIK